MGKTTIGWTDMSWNPIRGCTRVSEGCRNCYAERMAARFSGPGGPYEGLARNTSSGPRWTGEVRVVEEHMDDPTRWRKPRMVFVNSMSDLFHEGLHGNTISRVFHVMEANRRHTFQVLTKRPGRVVGWFADNYRSEWPSNVWIGTSIEDQETADERIPHLLRVPAPTRFLSVEPMLGPVDVDKWIRGAVAIDEPRPNWQVIGAAPKIHWVIVGGESGPGARPMHPSWAQSLRDQCVAARVPFFFKQWGGVDKKAAGRVLDGRMWSEMPEVARA